MWRWLSLLWIVAACMPTFAQVGQAWGSATSPEASEVAARAGIIFRGRVIAVVAEEARAPGEVSAVRVTFVVDDAVRGVALGQTITVRQWNHAIDEYRVGESLVLFLYAPSGALGLTSPVGGRAGHRRVDEIPAQWLDSLREPVIRDVPVRSRPTPLPKRPRRWPSGARAREVAP